MNNANEILFHPSALGKIMSGVKKKWDVENSLTCKRELVRIHREIKYGRYYTYSSKYTDKGIKTEQDAITLYSLVKNKYYKKNTLRIKNKWFDGEPDIIEGRETIDIKSCWSLDTLPHVLTDEVDQDYEYQGDGYLDLIEGDQHTVAYCLVNAMPQAITREKEKLWYALEQPAPDDPVYMSSVIEIEKKMIFDLESFMSDNPGFDLDCKDWVYDIPMEDRVVEFVIKRDQVRTNKIKDRITESREWMNKKLFV